MTTKISLARLPIGISTLFDCLGKAASDYVTDESPAFSVETTEADVAAEREKSIAECAYEGIPYPDYSPAELENTAVYRKIASHLPDYDALVFHGSAVAVDGEAYLFTASSGTGKTTHTNLWLKNIPGSYVVNGDKPILRLIDGKPFVCGTPWMGKEGLGRNAVVPLKAVCFLSRGAENRVTPTTFSAVMPKMIGQAYRPQNGAQLVKTLKLIEKIAGLTSLYELSCNMDDGAAIIAYEGMK